MDFIKVVLCLSARENHPFAECKIIRVHNSIGQSAFNIFLGRGQQQERTKITKTHMWGIMIAEMLTDSSSL